MGLHQSIRILVIIVFLGMQSLFLTMIIRERYALSITVTAVATLGLLSGLFWLIHSLKVHHEKYAYEKISIAVWVPIGAIVCYWGSVMAGLGSVIAAGLTGTIASFLPYLNKESDYLKKLPAAIYCGAFVGMSSTTIAPSISFIAAAGILAGGFYMFSKNLFIGVGGKLGTIAFASVVIIYFIHWLSI
jgi:hypothetical protein